MGKAYLHVSEEDYGRASKLKIIGNVGTFDCNHSPIAETLVQSLIMSAIEGLAEGLTLAEKSGAGADNFVSFVETLFPGPLAAYAKRMASGMRYTKDLDQR
jgi:3-hydroxyisobutyrate dehydrogenase-like beta-hydroxyacid dehydrogenase